MDRTAGILPTRHLDVEMVPVEAGAIESAVLDGLRPDIVVPMMSPVTAAAIEYGEFGLIQQFGVGTEAIDVSAATHAGVWVANMPGLNAVSVAEHAIAPLLVGLSASGPRRGNAHV
jgi:lactate dehydrogenase-like 2-hydroxyacid dehydrogenase